MNKMNKMMLEVITAGRKTLLHFRESAFDQVQSTQKQLGFNQLMFSIMNVAFWLRADLELLLRVSRWQNLSENDFGARCLADQIDLYKITMERMEIDTTKIVAVLDDFTKIGQNKGVVPIKPENNGEIIDKLTYYRKDELRKIFSRFYKTLSKVSHPDPFFISFPDKYRNEIENNLMNIFKLCKVQLDEEWELLKKHIGSGLTN